MEKEKKERKKEKMREIEEKMTPCISSLSSCVSEGTTTFCFVRMVRPSYLSFEVKSRRILSFLFSTRFERFALSLSLIVQLLRRLIEQKTKNLERFD